MPLSHRAAAGRFFDALPGPRKTLHWYEAAYHEIFNEEASLREQVMHDLRHWLPFSTAD